MNAYEVHYTYRVDGKFRVKGYAVVLAEHAEGALEAFRAVHPDGSNFDYKINKVIVSPLDFQRQDALAAFGA